MDPPEQRLKEPTEEYFTFIKPHHSMSPYDVFPDFIMMALWQMHNSLEDHNLLEMTESLKKSMIAY
jgi:hypothetical protein